MSNPYFDWPAKSESERFVRFDTVRAEDINNALDLLSLGLDKLPAPDVLWGGTQSYASDDGSANIYVITVAEEFIQSLSDGLMVRFKAANANTGASTLNVNGLGAKALKTQAGADLVANDITAGMIVEASYDGASFQLLNPQSSAVQAAASAAAAAGSAGSASGFASAASSSAGAASTSASSASSSATAAADLLDQFDDRYLGSKSSDPTLDNDGNALISGALYWNTTLKKMRVYDTTLGWNTIQDWGGGEVQNAAYTKPATVTTSATPAFNAAQSNIFYLSAALNANVTGATITNPADGQTISIRFVQDATGGRTVTFSTSIKAAGAIDPGANRVSWLTLTYVSSSARWEGAWSTVPA